MRSILNNKIVTRSELLNKHNILAKSPRSQLRIQQMAFMIVAVFFFFILVGLAFLGYQTKTIQGTYQDSQKNKAISSLQVITDMPEFTCGALCLDEDKLDVLSKMPEYDSFWDVSSIKVYKIYPAFTKEIKCPSPDCNYYDVYSSGKNETQYSTFVSLCRKIKEQDYVYNKCEIAKLLVGVA